MTTKIKSYFGLIIAKPGKLLTGGVRCRQSITFASRADARAWARAARGVDAGRGVIQSVQVCPSFMVRGCGMMEVR